MRTLFNLVFFLVLISSKSTAQVQPDKNLSEKDSIEFENQFMK